MVARIWIKIMYTIKHVHEKKYMKRAENVQNTINK